jgi:hypothetical protein
MHETVNMKSTKALNEQLHCASSPRTLCMNAWTLIACDCNHPEHKQLCEQMGAMPANIHISHLMHQFRGNTPASAVLILYIVYGTPVSGRILHW